MVSHYRLMSQKREFTDAGKYKPITKELSGVLDLPDYKIVAKGDKRVETLRQYGLRDDEIRLQLERERVSGVFDPSVSTLSVLKIWLCNQKKKKSFFHYYQCLKFWCVTL